MLTNKQKGFSLLELLVVIFIILLLGTISVIALNDQRARARDNQRISDIRMISTALEFYHSYEGEYPIVNDQLILGTGGMQKLCAKAVGSFVSTETPCNPESIYMSSIPTEPLSGHKYLYVGSGADYQISFQTEKNSELGQAGKYVATSNGIARVK